MDSKLASLQSTLWLLNKFCPGKKFDYLKSFFSIFRFENQFLFRFVKFTLLFLPLYHLILWSDPSQFNFVSLAINLLSTLLLKMVSGPQFMIDLIRPYFRLRKGAWLLISCTAKEYRSIWKQKAQFCFSFSTWLYYSAKNLNFSKSQSDC